MVFQSEERSHCPANTVALRPRTLRLVALHPAELLQAHDHAPTFRLSDEVVRDDEEPPQAHSPRPVVACRS